MISFFPETFPHSFPYFIFLFVSFFYFAPVSSIVSCFFSTLIIFHFFFWYCLYTKFTFLLFLTLFQVIYSSLLPYSSILFHSYILFNLSISILFHSSPCSLAFPQRSSELYLLQPYSDLSYAYKCFFFFTLFFYFIQFFSISPHLYFAPFFSMSSRFSPTSIRALSSPTLSWSPLYLQIFFFFSLFFPLPQFFLFLHTYI